MRIHACFDILVSAETVLCPELDDPENGFIIYSTNDDQQPPFPFGTEARYVCNSGFGVARGDGVRVCLGDVVNTVGEWTGEIPECSGECAV